MAKKRASPYRALSERDARGRDIINAKVLLVGAGGIGCELLKNLVLTGFVEIHIVDLDTIDQSNLNRQFLFGPEHLKQSKAKVTLQTPSLRTYANRQTQVAKETADKTFNKDQLVRIISHHANIKDPQFDLDFFEGFDLVFNALDNVDARRHVNKMIIAADLPMVDCGTTGFHGHTQVIKRGIFPCYDCTPKVTPTTFPVCTIRSTPSQPIHCIVWAKSYLFTEIFGISEEDMPELDFSEDGTNAEEIRKLREEATALKNIKDKSHLIEFPRLICEKVFGKDVERLLSMEEMWTTRKPPTPLDVAALQDKMTKAKLVGSDMAKNQQAVWTLEESFAVFVSSTMQLQQRLAAEKGLVLSFEKDDTDIMNFVAASANIRSYVFDIEPKSKWDIKQMAGNIIPAIATTNAMFAALAVLNSYKVLLAVRGQGLWTDAAVVYDNSTNQDRAIARQTAVDAINPHCHVCGIARRQIWVDLQETTLQHLVDFLKQNWQYDEDEITIYKGNSEVIYDPDMPDHMEKTLQSLVNHENSLEVEDLSESPKANLMLRLKHKYVQPALGIV